MKKSLIILFFLFLLPASIFADVYYVATPANEGNDANPGTIGSPFATWERLGDFLTAGDTGYIRGGTYLPTKARTNRYMCLFENLHGTASDTIKIFAYPGEVPIFDFDAVTNFMNTAILVGFRECSYLHIKGLTICNAEQPSSPVGPVDGFYFWESPHNVIEHCTAHHIAGMGFIVHGLYWLDLEDGGTIHSSDNLFLNCDSYSNEDPLSSYDNANGFALGWTRICENTTYRGCRAWYNSDDGFDNYQGGSLNVVYENCWSFMNGYVGGMPGGGGIGAGFKLGPSPDNLLNTNIYTLVNCVTTLNYGNTGGFTGNGHWGAGSGYPVGFQNMYSCGTTLYNCLAYYNDYMGFFFTWESNPLTTIKNCIAHYNDGINDYWSQAMSYDGHHTNWIESYNTWNNNTLHYFPYQPGGQYISITLSDADFENLDATQLYGARQANGNLPVVTFGHLAVGSDLIEGGIGVGYPYDGDAPDIGVYWDYLGADEEPPPANLPTVTTTTPTIVYTRLAIIGGNVTDDGGGTVSTRGVCYSTSINPTTSSSKIAHGTGEGAWTDYLPNLTANTTYHVKSYATNETGTVYGSDIEFTMPKKSKLMDIGYELRDDYRVVIIR